MIAIRKPVPTFRDHAEIHMIALTARRRKSGGRTLVNARETATTGPKPGKYRVTGSLEESYCCPTSAHRPPRWIATRESCVDPVLSVPDSSAPSPPGPSGSGLFAGEIIPPLGQRELVLFLFGASTTPVVIPERASASSDVQLHIRESITTIMSVDSRPGPSGRSGMTGDCLAGVQRSGVIAAPSIGPGFSRLPSWT